MINLGFLQSIVVLGVTVAAALSPASEAFAQGLIWSLPQDGSWIRFEGEMTQTELRPDSPDGDVEMTWIQHVVIKSVGQEDAEYDGQSVACRWIEIVTLTGKTSEAGIDTGPAGTAIYKVLVPESAVTGETIDAETIPVAYLPIVKGYRKIGARDIEALDSPVLQIYPVVSLVRHFENLKAADAGPEDIDTPVGIIPAQKYVGSLQQESRTTRITESAELWRSNDVPFGLAKWTFNGTREIKESFEPREAFHDVTEITVEMTVHETGMNAETELPTPAE